MAFKYKCVKGMSRFGPTSRELEQIVDQFIWMNAQLDLSTEEIEQLGWLAVGLFHSPNGLPTSAWVNVNKSAAKRGLGIFIPMVDRDRGFEDSIMQRAAANWMLVQQRLPGVHEAVDPAEPAPAAGQQTAA